ncbi:hypothetical protein [Streptomyces acidiscabies]|uniref:Tachylectin 2 domain-containing protein n=1 Tax=Streptomyces acidiscabies TaxID=42234 RepID=A0AAP6BB85_9ACTN|nr:hypothetical protein [Streptomyces acidiscabies]MBP5938021.1 hypothetical protein [Streptomyces sp. LBUM 1476]MBZ3909024.1 hypothetical protein [Streptomyces acidiscabies]MDX2961560.1 hypothetical protein [Streptomyces acidiscabies]MDX3016572.1 hypothetical protein [Streptomyces acidiscabies]MDX3788523.1 hypothetical protein [Streptomyces acidiscabies]
MRDEPPDDRPNTHNSASGGVFHSPVVQTGQVRDVHIHQGASRKPPSRPRLVALVAVLACLAGAIAAVSLGGLLEGRTPSGTASPAPESGHLYAISSKDATVWSWSSRTGWTQIGGTPAGEIAAGPAGLFATNPVDGRIFRYGDAGGWESVGAGTDGQTLAVGDHLWVRDSGAVRQWDPRTRAWTTVRNGPTAQIYGGPAGLFATEPAGEHALTRREPDTGKWLLTGRGALGFAVGERLYGLSRMDLRVYRWNGSGGVDDWTPLGEAEFDGVHAGGAGLFATRDGRLFAYDEVSGRWRGTGDAAGSGAAYAVAADHVYRQDSEGVWQWTGTARREGAWVRIGTPAAGLAASG